MLAHNRALLSFVRGWYWERVAMPKQLQTKFENREVSTKNNGKNYRNKSDLTVLYTYLELIFMLSIFCSRHGQIQWQKDDHRAQVMAAASRPASPPVVQVARDLHRERTEIRPRNFSVKKRNTCTYSWYGRKA